MSEETPWYEEYSKKPRGEYSPKLFARAAEDDPENRRGHVMHHHSDYEDSDLQDAIKHGLTILRADPERVLMVGGDLLPDARRTYRHVCWNTDDHTYEMMKEPARTSLERYNRKQHKTIADVFDALDSVFHYDSLVFPVLIWQKNSPFNLSQNRDNTGFIIGA